MGNKANYAGSMQAEFDTRSKTTENALQLLSNKLTNLAIAVGNAFLPAITAGAKALGAMADALRWVAETRVGQVILTLAGGLAAAVLAVTAFSAGMWAVSKAAPVVSTTLTGIRMALLALGWPVWALIAAVGLLYVAYKKNFGGIATTLNRWGRNISLVVRGVTAIFESLKGSTFEIRGELARDIRAAGLERLVVTVGRAVYRIKEFFAGIWEGLNFDGAVAVLIPAILKIGELFDFVGKRVEEAFGFEVTSAASEARGLGEVLGGFLSWILEGLATVIANLVRGIESLIAAFRWLGAVLTGDWATAAEMAQSVWDNFCASLMAFADLFRIGDWLRNAWAQATEWLAGIDLFESGARLLDTFKEGILSKVESLKQTFSDALASLRNLLPFSDAKEGPLSTLTLSGARLMSTLGEGMNAGFPGLYATLSGKLGSLKESISSWWDGLWKTTDVPVPATGEQPVVPDAPGMPADLAEEQERRARAAGDRAAAPQSWTLHIANITLPNVKDAQDFFADLQAAATEMGENMA